MAALANPSRVRAIAIYEPTFFAVVDAQNPAPNAVDGIRNAVSAVKSALESGDPNAARHFIDYWSGVGSWDSTPESRKPAIAESIKYLAGWAKAVMTEPTPASAFSALEMPILYMVGESSPDAAHAVARALVPNLPNARLVEFSGLGHMAPITDSSQVNAAIIEFLNEIRARN